MSAAQFVFALHLGGDAPYVWTAVGVTVLALAIEACALSIRGRDLARRIDHTDASGERR
ncbi:MAG TPA: heme exporter protein CcmD [Usitatibacter sp.]|nr:heme exporter protein CcmD [Usitatibacter sp.]